MAVSQNGIFLAFPIDFFNRSNSNMTVTVDTDLVERGVAISVDGEGVDCVCSMIF